MNVSSKPIICCGFTPCVQRIVEFAFVEKGGVNRAERVTLGVGGKGANTARMIKQQGERALLSGFVGGANGELLETMLREQGVEFRHVKVAGETRFCQTLVEAGNPETTELVEEMPPLAGAEWAQMEALLASLDLLGVVAASGKLPAGAPVEAYAEVARLVALQGGRLILDAPGDPMLSALEHRPALVKINDEELFASVGGDDLADSSRRLLERGAQAVLITRGARTAFYFDANQALELIPPSVKAINAVGSGDAVTAGLSVVLQQGGAMAEALVNGMACGAANTLSLVSGSFEMADVEALRKCVVIRPV